MAKVTSKLQVTLPKALAEHHGVRPGDEITWESAGDVIRVIPRGRAAGPDVQVRLRYFDEATARQRRRNRSRRAAAKGGTRGWTREELYERGRAR
jgi:bifunctional DNA-binding transcriptional regulator/antitoxin component of YhaV-PrlF toxin-antitoxin module